jgi:hypothetical protein
MDERFACVDEPSMDVRDVEGADLDGFEAVIHLAAISNDPAALIDAPAADCAQLLADHHCERKGEP